MSTNDAQTEARAAVEKLMAAHWRWLKQAHWATALSLLVGVVAASWTWFAQDPRDRDSRMFGGVLAVGLGVYLLGLVLSRLAFPKPRAQCPQCGDDWTGRDPNDDWLTWNCCPNCGLSLHNQAAEVAQAGPASRLEVR